MMRLFIIGIILVAVIVGVFSLTLNTEQLVKVIVFRDFFEATQPILIFGALVKYLCSCCTSCGCQKK